MADQAPVILAQAAGYAGFRTIATGLRLGLVAALDAAPATSAQLAERLGLDAFYVSVWCRSALASGVLERDGDGFALAPHMGTLLLDAGSPGYVGGLFPVLSQPEVFDRFKASLTSGARTWWDETSPAWIDGVSSTGRPSYTRLVPGGLSQVPGLTDRLDAGCHVVDTACGIGAGVLRLADQYRECHVSGVDGDAHSIARAELAVDAAGIAERVRLVCSPLEQMCLEEPATLVVNNISMHECRDVDQVTDNVAATLEPGGWFVISDFPFPDSDAGLANVPGRIMCAIQHFEAQIGDQLLPRSAYDALLDRHEFTDIGAVSLTPMHALTYGRRRR